MSLPTRRLPATKIRKINIRTDRFNGGVNELVSPPRLKKNEAVEVKNLMLVEDGLWSKAWGTDYYGADAGGDIVDGWVEYRASDGSRELIIFANGLARKSTDDGASWSTISGYTPTAGTPVCAVQVGDYLYACNGTDNLARYNGTSFSTYTQRSAPANLTATRNTLGSGSYNYYYTVTAHNDVGETTSATEATEDVDEDRDSWSGDDAIDLDWDDVTGATYYTVYFGTTSGYLEKLADVTVSEYKDDGTASPNPYIEPPDANTTGGPLFKRMMVSDGRLWGTDDPNNEWRVYFTGKGGRLGIFSYAYGGGWIDLEKGGKAPAKGMIEFQGKATIFCPTPEGKGNTFQISLSYNDTWNFWDPTASKLTGQVAAVAPAGIVEAENDIYFITRKGVYILGNEPNIMSDVLRTSELSAKIRGYIEAISDTDLALITAYYKDGKVFFSTPTRTFYYDREHLCWVKEWTFGTSLLGEYTDTNGRTKFLGGMATDGYLIEISESHQGHLGVAFTQKYLSPQFPINKKDWTRFGKVKKAYVRLGNPEGSVSFKVLGTQRNTAFSEVTTKTITRETSNSGLGWDQLGAVQLGTSDGTPTVFQEANLPRYVKVNKKLRDIQFELSASSLAAKFTLLGLMAEGFELDMAPPSDWKLS